MLEKGVAVDGVMAQDAKQVNALWSWREKIPESISKSGTAMTYDVAMEVPLLYKLVEDAKSHFAEKNLLGPGKLYSNLLGFGHVGDGVCIYLYKLYYNFLICFYAELAHYG